VGNPTTDGLKVHSLRRGCSPKRQDKVVNLGKLYPHKGFGLPRSRFFVWGAVGTGAVGAGCCAWRMECWPPRMGALVCVWMVSRQWLYLYCGRLMDLAAVDGVWRRRPPATCCMGNPTTGRLRMRSPGALSLPGAVATGGGSWNVVCCMEGVNRPRSPLLGGGVGAVGAGRCVWGSRAGHALGGEPLSRPPRVADLGMLSPL
jgi:hypothetical protein